MIVLLAVLSQMLLAPRDLLRLAEAASGPNLPPDWMVRPVAGRSAPAFAVAGGGDQLVFRLSGAGRAAWFYCDAAPAIVEGSGRLRWSWRVLEAPAEADLRRKQRDDSPIRIYVVFGKQGGLFRRSAQVIFYSFGNAEPEGFEGPSHVGDRYHIIRVDGPPEYSVWQDHAADVFADYWRIWNRTPPPITAVGVMQDTDQTGQYAVAELRRLEWGTP